MPSSLFMALSQSTPTGQSRDRFGNRELSRFLGTSAILLALSAISATAQQTATTTTVTIPTATPTIKPTAVSANQLLDEASAGALAAAIEDALGVSGVKVQIFNGKDGKKVAVLSGDLATNGDATAKIIERAQKMVPLIVDNVVSLLTPEQQTILPASAPDETEQVHRRAEVASLWTRTFAPTSVGSSPDAAKDKDTIPKPSDSDDTNRASRLANTLNKFHDAPAEAPYVEAQGSSLLFLKGPRENVVAIKRDLLKLDAAWPQVQLDIWTVQVSGDSKSIAKNAAAIREKFNRANQAMQMVKTLLGDAAQNPQYFDMTDDLLQETNRGMLKKIGFDPNCVRPLSLTEMLIFLGLQTAWVDGDGIPIKDCHAVRMKDCKNCHVVHSYKGLLSSWSHVPKESRERLARVYTIRKLQCQVAEALNTSPALLAALDNHFKNKDGKAEPRNLLPSLFAAYSSNPASDRAGIFQFAQAAKNFKDAKRPILDQEKDIANLRATAAASDRLIKAATDAFASDMQEMFLQPIFDGVSSQAIKTTSGVALTGKARLVVTSRLETGIRPEVASYVETTRPKPLDINTLKGFLGATPTATPAPMADSTAATPAVAGGIPALGGLLSQPQLLLLGAALNPPEPEITQVAPGISIDVRPTVLPDGGSARLQLDFTFGVKSTVQNEITMNDGRRKSVPADGIVSNKVKTDLNISAFELFNVSSFSIESSHPRSRYIPVIGSIPLLGELIKKPPKNKVTRHESIVLVNAVILPRVLDLTHFYGD